MPNMKEIKNHINSVRDTKKITNAMYLIASTKMRKAKSGLDKTRPYFDAMRGEIKRIFRRAPYVDSRYFYPANGKILEGGTYGCLVITSDKGLAGAYNINAIRAAESLLKKTRENETFCCWGIRKTIFLTKENSYRTPVFYIQLKTRRCREREKFHRFSIPDARFRASQYKIYVVYTDWKNGLTEEATTARLLPFHRNEFMNENEKNITTPFEFLNSVEMVLDTMIPSYMSRDICAALLSICFC